MQCPRCLNEDSSYFFKGSKGYYCRKCISFSRVLIEESLSSTPISIVHKEAFEYSLPYPLTPQQKKIAHLTACHINENDVLIHAVCGSGKTEMVVETIYQALQKKKTVAFAIARRQVVLEITKRLTSLFPKAKVIPVCQGFTKELQGDLIVCTTHQLYRYYHAFDILILDEPDAFPFFGNPVLHGIAKTACRGHTVYLTATPDKELYKRIEDKTIIYYQLNRRPHQHDLPVPVCKIHSLPVQIACLLHWLNENQSHPRMIFVPTIHEATLLYRLLLLFMECCLVTSKIENKDAVIGTYRKKRNAIMIATTVMERGVTIPNVSVAVLHANSPVFSKASLIQIAGRVGRTFQYPDGNVLFLCNEKSRNVSSCIQELQRTNQCAV